MKLHEIFTKDITRSIDGVVKVGNQAQDVTKTELEEYVITKEIDKHMRKFFGSLTETESSGAQNTGIWISGFFGSGKSHFLKMMGLVLQNETTGDMGPIEYFDAKIEDKLFYADVKKYVESHNCHTVLFNIDAISSHHSGGDKDAIVESCMKAFFKSLGFFHQKLWLAEKERHLWKEGKFDEFKMVFQQNEGISWEDARVNIDLEVGAAAKALMQVKGVEEESARRWFDGKYQMDSYSLSVQDFAQIINDFCEISGDDTRVFFMIDEVGQYIGNNCQLMLNLQTVTELLGTAVRGKAWVVITSQEAIDKVTNMEGVSSTDFSKIKGRFPIQLSLSSSNVDDVIQKRLLEKTPDAEKSLKDLYEKEQQHMRNMYRFNGYESKFYTNDDHFSKLYPLVPYQIDLLKESLNEIGNSGYAGSHLSRGERSLLTFFKEAIQSYADDSVGRIISFADLYDALESWIETYIKSTIERASKLDNLPPHAIDVLKVLFMLKYVKMISLNTDNIATLLISHVNEDMVVLKKQVEEALIFLQKHNFVNKGVDAWEFLSNEEQEMERQINNTPIDELDVYAQVHDLIFENHQYGLSKKYQHDKYHNIGFKKLVDEYEKVNNDAQLSVKVLWSNSAQESDGFSFSASQIRVVLPEDKISELRGMISKCKKIEKFILQNANDKNSERATQKSKEKDLLLKKAATLLDDALNESQLFLGSQELEVGGTQFKERMQKALSRLFLNVYTEFSVLKKSYKDDDIKSMLAKANKVATQESLMEEMNPNQGAQSRVSDFIMRQVGQSYTVTLKTLQDEFTGIPFGRSLSDVAGVLAELYIAKGLILKYDGSTLDISDVRLVDYLTKSTHKERLIISPKQTIDTRVVRDVAELMSSLGMEVSAKSQADQDALYKGILERRSTTVSSLESLQQQYSYRTYPGQEKIVVLLEHIKNILPHLEQKGLFDVLLEKRDELVQAYKDAGVVRDFFGSKQKEIFDTGLASVSRYGSIATMLDGEATEYLAQLGAILDADEPYTDIPQIKQLVSRLDTSYQGLLESKRSTLKTKAEGLVGQLIDADSLESDLKAQVESKLTSLVYTPIDQTQEIAELMSREDQLPKLVEQVQSFILDAQKEAGQEQTTIPQKRTIKLKNLHSGSVSISSEEDLETFVKDLSQKLRDELKDGETIVII